MPFEAVLAVMLTACAFVLVTWRRNERARLARLEALAASLGMRLEVARGRLGVPTGRITLDDPADGLRLMIGPGRSRSRAPGRLTTGPMTLTLADPRLTGALLIASPRKADRMGEAMATLAGALDNPMARRMASALKGREIGERLGELQDYSERAGPGVTLLSSVDPRGFVDLPALAGIIRALAAMPGGQTAAITLSEAGSKLEMPGQDGSEAAIRSAIALGRRVAKVLAP